MNNKLLGLLFVIVGVLGMYTTLECLGDTDNPLFILFMVTAIGLIFSGICCSADGTKLGEMVEKFLTKGSNKY